MIRSLTKYFDELIGTPCWHVKQGFGSFLTFEFGSPKQEISKVFNTKSSIIPATHQRTVSIHGDWYLWVYCCGWRIVQENHFVADHESENDKIQIACSSLDGQIIEEIEVDLDTSHTKFFFDLGGYLETGPYDKELNDQWYIYCPDGNVFTLRSDGKFSFQSGATSENIAKWIKLTKTEPANQL
ncbi:MAG: hypothetical protein GY705_02770 [Bacteroidetes bacterium]|nr:hypothetical protein [Bacteroidota bacterium]